ncbi:MAG: hypothetical protein CMA25_03175 [Euryarchaeota archaeon]|nr:hypothetical protein [Euryarchaeota archaeon]|tara:strand:+ start:1103 stop:2050 length:948 start_codon:yes stop_codon:yes gene_type:complete
MRSRNLFIHLKLLIVAAIWGGGWVAGRVLALDAPPLTGALIRYMIALPLFFIWLRFTTGVKLPSMSQLKIVIAIGFYSTFVYQALFMFGMKYTAAGDASLMITFNPLFTALLAAIMLNHRYTYRLFIGIFLGVIGISILFLASPNVDIPFQSRSIGNIFIALAALSWATSSIYMTKGMSEFEHGEEPLTPLEITLWASVVGMIFMTPWALFETIEGGWPSISFEGWVSILFLAILSTVVCYVWYADGILVIGPEKSSLYIYLVPPFGILSGWLILDEKLGWSLLWSFLLICSGVALAQSDKNHHEQHPPPSEHVD